MMKKTILAAAIAAAMTTGVVSAKVVEAPKEPVVMEHIKPGSIRI